ncbi:MAG: dihydrodipicolinate synthase family protein [Verrucomicrobiota bacterium]
MSKPPSLSRDETQQHLFPAGPPTLWCPPLTHYAQDGQIDQERLAAHFHFMQPWVKGFLVPGTTGDGWELFPAEKAALLDAVLRNVRGSDAQVLLGALDPDASAAKRIIQAGWHHLETRQAGDTPLATLRKNQVCGFAICPPRGAQLSQEEIGQGLSAVLDLGLPTALYQLPQVTQNEMSPPLVADLARRFAHFILFKDTSGADRVATAKLDLGGVFLVRGMERDYASSLKVGGGPYDGYLLSTANSFAAPLSKIRELLAVERRRGSQPFVGAIEFRRGRAFQHRGRRRPREQVHQREQVGRSLLRPWTRRSQPGATPIALGVLAHSGDGAGGWGLASPAWLHPARGYLE